MSLEQVLPPAERVHFEFLAGGEYALRLVHEAKHDHVELLYPHPIALEPGAPQELHWRVEARRLRFRALGRR